jgi:EAL domain-containing protein (putative c-di-GMP-specific phosphodiesterase class I)
MSGAPTPGLVSNLGLPLERIEPELAGRRQLAMVSISVLQREGGGGQGQWRDYERVLAEIAEFLSRYCRRRMRRGDRLLSPVLAGNTFVVLLEPPRERDELEASDLERVRLRLERGVMSHLAQCLPRAAIEHFGVYVGAPVLRHDPLAERGRDVLLGLEAAVAGAVRDSRAERARLGTQLGELLRTGELGTVYQPILDLQQRRVVGYEALSRLSALPFRSPVPMFRAAQASGVLWELERLCRQRALELHPPLLGDQILFLNIEPDAVHDPSLTGQAFRDRVRQAGLEPEQLVLEVTEHVAVRDFPAFRGAIARARAAGYRVAMDDVGSGYAGLRAIAELQPDFLKVDMSLVRDLHAQPIKRELIATIRRFSERAGIRVVAEGVEIAAELESLAETGVRWAQGFLFAHPTERPSAPDWSTLRREVDRR